MKIDFSRVIEGLDGEVMKDGAKPLTLRAIAVNALLSELKDDGGLRGEDKCMLWNLAQRINGSKEPLILPIEDIATIKERVGKAYRQIIVGPAFHLIENDG